jgi:hypothetical protein
MISWARVDEWTMVDQRVSAAVEDLRLAALKLADAVAAGWPVPAQAVDDLEGIRAVLSILGRTVERYGMVHLESQVRDSPLHDVASQVENRTWDAVGDLRKAADSVCYLQVLIEHVLAEVGLGKAARG